LARDLPPGWVEQCRQFLREVGGEHFDETDRFLTRNRVFVDRTRTSACCRKEVAIDYGATGPNLRGSGVDFRFAKAHPYLVYDQLEFDVPSVSVGGLL